MHYTQQQQQQQQQHELQPQAPRQFFQAPTNVSNAAQHQGYVGPIFSNYNHHRTTTLNHRHLQDGGEANDILLSSSYEGGQGGNDLLRKYQPSRQLPLKFDTVDIDFLADGENEDLVLKIEKDDHDLFDDMIGRDDCSRGGAPGSQRPRSWSDNFVALPTLDEIMLSEHAGNSSRRE
jgi:hypothetical protein